jgi:uncharacterized YigZ family protein
VKLLEPTGRATAEHVVKGSRFVGLAAPATTVAEADAELADMRKHYADASHVVHAYLVGAPEREIGSLSDAGEPKGTAGRPVMENLRGSGIRNVIVAVVRYFGGTKLGTGGLVRAYSDTAKMTLAGLPVRPLVHRERITIVVGYSHFEAVRRHLDDRHAEILSEQFDTGVRVELSVDRGRVDGLLAALRDITAGAVEVERHRS